MSKLSLTVPAELLERLRAIAAQREITLEECAIEAFADYAASWEDFVRTLEHLDSAEGERTVLRAVNEK